MNRLKELCIIDVEATGLSPDSHPIEVAFLTISGYSIEFLINPNTVEHWTHWDYNAQDIHNISRETCIREGISVWDAATKLNSQLNGCLAISDAAGHDLMWIDQIFEESGIERLFSILDLRQFIDITKQDPCLMSAYWDLKKSEKTIHRAAADCSQILKTALEVGIKF